MIVEDTVAELRSIAKGLRPSILDDLGLVASINQVLSEAAERNGSRRRSASPGPERDWRPRSSWHSSASPRRRYPTSSGMRQPVMWMSGSISRSYGLRLRVKDDGVGFDVRDDFREDGHRLTGAAGMTERAHLIGSRAQIHSERGAGTTVVVWVRATILDQN